jgi:hypothetical protein
MVVPNLQDIDTDVLEKKVASVALFDLPPREGVITVRDAGEEDIGTANHGSVVWVRAAVDGRKGRCLGAVIVKEEAKERGWVERAEATAEHRGGTSGAEEGAVGKRDADEAQE